LKKGRWKKRIEAKKTIDMFKTKEEGDDMFAGLSTTKKRNSSTKTKVIAKPEEYKGIEIGTNVEEKLFVLKCFVKDDLAYLKIKGLELETEFIIEGDKQFIKEIKLEEDDSKNEDVSNMFAMEDETNETEEDTNPILELTTSLTEEIVIVVKSNKESIEEGDVVTIKEKNGEKEVTIILKSN